jgi:hypothetical protein
MQHEFGFYWPPYANPHIILPDGKTQIQCVVEDFVPYVVEDFGTVCPIATVTNSNPSSSSRAVDPDDMSLADLVRDESLKQSAKKQAVEAKDAENDASGCKEQEKTVVAGTGGKLNKDDIPNETRSKVHLSYVNARTEKPLLCCLPASKNAAKARSQT